MARLVPLLDARKLARQNEIRYKSLNADHEAAKARASAADKGLEASYRAGFDNYLVPFANQFARLRNVDLDDVPTQVACPELTAIDVELKKVSAEAVRGLAALAGGGAVGAAAGGVTFAAVAALATASTGTAIGTLSGAAATSATLAWLGGGSLAAGGAGVAGGTLVLASVVAVPVAVAAAGFLWWKGNRDLKVQQRVEQDLKRGRANSDLKIAAIDLAIRQKTDSAGVVERLTGAGEPRLQQLEALIDFNSDYGTFTDVEKAVVAELAALATTMVAVMKCPILADDGTVTELSKRTLASASTIADQMAA